MLEIFLIVNKFSAFNKFLAESDRKISFLKKTAADEVLFTPKNYSFHVRSNEGVQHCGLLMPFRKTPKNRFRLCLNGEDWDQLIFLFFMRHLLTNPKNRNRDKVSDKFSH